jgi:hypothetical protein
MPQWRQAAETPLYHNRFALWVLKTPQDSPVMPIRKGPVGDSSRDRIAWYRA